jgi:serine/threonine protein phosphatase PrpC
MYVCSVGGCGAILGRRDSTGSYGEEEKCEIEDHGSHSVVEEARRIAIPLAADHTPYCQAELERITLAGAEVKHSDQIEYTNVICDSNEQTNDGNKRSQRIFMPGKSFPGTRFTRSICDSALEEIGILSDPNVVSCDLTANDDILIIASNGVFEFLTNQEVINICSACHDPLQASEAVTKAAYEKWIEHTNRCDDITVIVCFLSNLCQSSQTIEMSLDVNAMVDDLELE